MLAHTLVALEQHLVATDHDDPSTPNQRQDGSLHGVVTGVVQLHDRRTLDEDDREATDDAHVPHDFVITFQLAAAA